MSRESVKRQVRKRDRFMCQYCGKRGEQYAHIIPDSDGGSYTLENLVFLCYTHHTQLEPARTNDEMKGKLQQIGKKLRDQPKIDNLLSYIFAWPAGKEIVVILGGGIKFIGQERILESAKESDNPYLTLRINKFGTLSIDAHLEDETGNVFLKIDDSELEVHTSNVLDIAISKHSITFEHKDKKIVLKIRQSKNLDIHITGSIYLNSGYFLITKTMIKDLQHGNIFSNNMKSKTQQGILLSPDKIAF